MTRFTALVGCEHPIQLAAMSRVNTAALAAGVSNLGGLGMLASGRGSCDDTIKVIDGVLALTDRPIGAGFLVPFLDRDALDVAAERLPIVEFFWGTPDASLLPDGVITGWQVGTVDEARQAADAGCGYVIAQGVEAGGHVRGIVPLVELLPEVRAAVDLPVVASGGVGTADDVRSALLRGADAVRVGTRFVATIESDAHEQWIAHLIAASAADTVLSSAFDVGWPDAPVRVLASSLAAASAIADGTVARMALDGGQVVDIPRFSPTPPTRSTTGTIDAMALYAGTSVDAVTERTTLAAVMSELIEGTRPR